MGVAYAYRDVLEQYLAKVVSLIRLSRASVLLGSFWKKLTSSSVAFRRVSR